MEGFLRSALLALLAVAGSASAQVDIDAYLKNDKLNDLRLSPTGEYLAATVPFDDRTGLVIFRRSDMQITGTFSLGKNSYVDDFEWASDERVLIAIADKLGQLDQPTPTGELYAINANGRGADVLVGYRVPDQGLGSRIQTKKSELVAAYLSNTLPGDDRNVVVSIWPFTRREEPFTSAEQLDVYTGRRRVLARAPIQNATFTTDNSGEVRLASGFGSDNVQKLFYRQGSGWKMINDRALSGHVEEPIGFSEDNKIAYLQVGQRSGPDAIVAWDTVSGERREVARDPLADPSRVIYRNGTGIPVGILVDADKPRTLFFDPASPEARMYRSLEAAFAGQAVYITSSTRDGRVVLVHTYSATDPGEFYLFDTVAKHAELAFANRDWIDPRTSADVEPISFKARDGLQLHGYLTRPQGSKGKPLPMVVLPHGGPFGVADSWGFDREAQMLAAAGYAVLQVNYRGSGNYGHAFEAAGARQWGGRMQDDVTDATHWAIDQGYADADRICIYGASYGGYAALMGAAKEPSLYKCAAGYVGVYDLPMMFVRGDVRTRGHGETYLKEWIGAPDSLDDVSPVNLADRIKVPVFLAAGGEDQRAPIQHSKKMAAALTKAGVPVETLYFDNEGHGFYTEEHRRAFYTELLAFLNRSLGGAQAAAH